MEERSPAQVYALVIGLTLVVAGIAGFFYSASFSTGDGTERDAVLGILDVNGWHNLVHIATGAIGLAVAGSYGGARAYALGLGVVYLLVALLGFIAGDGDEILNLIPVNTEDNFLHLLIGIAGVGAGLATPASGALPGGWAALAPQALLDVVRDAADRLLERVQARGVTLLLLLAGSDQHEPAGGHAAHHDRGGRARPVARVAHRGQLPVGQLRGGDLGQLGEAALEPVAERLGRLDRHEGRAQQAAPRVHVTHRRPPRGSPPAA